MSAPATDPCIYLVHQVRRLPLVFDAIQWNGSSESTFNVAYWVGKMPGGMPGFRIKKPGILGRAWRYVLSPVVHAEPEAEVYDRLHKTWVTVLKNQWVIKGAQGEFYPIAEEALYRSYVFICHVNEPQKEE